MFRGLFGAAALTEEGGQSVVGAGAASVELTTPQALAGEFTDAAADPAGRREYLAALELRVASLAATAERLRGVSGVRVEPGRVVVPAESAFNTTLVFTA